MATCAQFCISMTSARSATRISTDDRKSAAPSSPASARRVASAMGEATMMSESKKSANSLTAPLQRRSGRVGEGARGVRGGGGRAAGVALLCSCSCCSVPLPPGQWQHCLTVRSHQVGQASANKQHACTTCHCRHACLPQAPAQVAAQPDRPSKIRKPRSAGRHAPAQPLTASA